MSGVDRIAVAALAARFSLGSDAAEQLAIFAELLASDPTAPTTIRSPARVVDEHLADTLVALDLPQVRDAGTIADLGSGAGVPGVPLAIARPDARVVLVESSARKCRFLDRAVSTCRLPKVEVVHSRIEVWFEGVGEQDLVTARALGPLPVVAEYAAPLLRIGGSLVAWRGARDASAETAANRAASTLGLGAATLERVHPYPAARQRHLLVTTKVGPTPDRYPRRPGMAQKRPLGSPRGGG